MEEIQDNLITFRPTEANRRILEINSENSGMTEDELMNHFIANNSSKQRPIIERHESTIKSQSEEIESYQEQISTLEDKNNALENRVSELKSKVNFLNKEKATFVPDSQELEDALFNLKRVSSQHDVLFEKLETYETELLDDCFEKVQGSTLLLTGDSDEEFEILTRANLVNALVFQYSLHLKGLETEIDEEEEEED
jgi:predicted RNase H-like nuclease (RuvC/YqgF family)